ncbi:general substrate transporter [Aaosphaeria arxii CBS 175.79]|uniref:General substrate transporter n=1 Tax=Aaosphaeria arxii CBS 175.79 TaxID=1450172 RepID=A0A6A5X7I0_9PLEO|nr:general substrate transporter [Aaosphaeria arxii CBS 175.79]KAF2008744.1 general substrate transporter [Aaosphaeria arxii CBS 175.79]
MQVNSASQQTENDAAAKGQALSGYESLTRWETVKTFKIATLVCFAAAFSAATDGYQIGMNASIVANKGFVLEFATKTNAKGQLFLESPILSGWSSIQSVGQIIGMTTLPFISSRWGRKISMYTYWFILAMSVLAESLARRWEIWLLAKLLAGIGVGCLQSTLPTYIAEVAPVKIRGGLLMCYSFWWTVGSFFAYVALQTMAKKHPYIWLHPIYTQWAQIGIMLGIYIFLPESPAWCVTVNQMERAKKELLRMNGKVEGYNVDQQLQVLVLAIDHERTVAAEQRQEKWYAIFRGTDGRRTLTALWTNMSQQFIGLTLFGTFGTYFFQQAGLADPFKIKLITSSLNIATVIIIIFISDRLGRRWIACCATTLCWAACTCIGILGVTKKVRATDYLFVLFACLWNIGMTSNGAAGWGFIGEISSQRLRPYTAGFGAAATCVVGVVMNVLVPYMTNANAWNWGYKTGWFYAGVGLPCVIGCWLLIPETAGRSAAELDELFERKIKPWRFAKTETATQRVVNMEKEY